MKSWLPWASDNPFRDIYDGDFNLDPVPQVTPVEASTDPDEPWLTVREIVALAEEIGLSVMTLKDFEKFCLPCFKVRKDRGWW